MAVTTGLFEPDGGGVGVAGGLRTNEANRVPPWIESFTAATADTSVSSTAVSDLTGATLGFTPVVDCRVEIKGVFDVGCVAFTSAAVFVGALYINRASAGWVDESMQHALFSASALGQRATISRTWTPLLLAGVPVQFKLTGFLASSGTITYTAYQGHTGFSLFGVGRF